MDLVVGHPRPSLSGTGVLCAKEYKMTLWQSPNPSLCGCWCCWSRDIMCSLRSCSWSCFTLMCNCEYLHPRSTGSAVQDLSRRHSQSSPPNVSELWVFSPMKSFSNNSCSVCPWISLQSSRREKRCTSCQQRCEHPKLSSECQVSKNWSIPTRWLCFRMKRR